MAIAGMIDEEIELWPILRSFGDIAHIGIAPKVWVTLLQSLGEQSLVDANIGKTGLHRLLIEGIDERFVIEPPRFGQIFVRVVADGIAFEGVRPKRNVAVDCVEPARCARLRSEEHTSELQSLMRISYAVFCLKKKT